MKRVAEGTIWKSLVTGGEVQVMYQAVDEWVGVKILGTTLVEPYVELASSAFGTKLVQVEDKD
jgi:hypothetical protein